MAIFFAGQIVTAADLTTASTARVGYAQRTTTSTTANSATEVPVLRIDNVPIVGGKTYDLGVRGHRDGTVATDTLRARVRFNQTGAAATTSDPILPGFSNFSAVNTGPMSWGTTFIAGGSGLWSFLLCIARPTGSGTVDFFCDVDRLTEMVIDLMGTIADTGVDM